MCEMSVNNELARYADEGSERLKTKNEEDINFCLKMVIKQTTSG